MYSGGKFTSTSWFKYGCTCTRRQVGLCRVEIPPADRPWAANGRLALQRRFPHLGLHVLKSVPRKRNKEIKLMKLRRVQEGGVQGSDGIRSGIPEDNTWTVAMIASMSLVT
jgi:hypothetical protein